MPSFVLSKDISEADWDPLFVVDMHAFQNSPEVLALSPGGLSPSHRASNVSAFRRNVFGGPVDRVYAKITEIESGQITSFISARIYRGPKGVIDGDLATEPPPIELPGIEDIEDRKFFEWYWNTNRAALRGCQQMQVPHVFIQALGTDPVWQRNGAASMLMKWLLEFVAEQKLGRCALQASPMATGIGFYEKFGFRVIEKVEFVDEDRFPGRKGTPVLTMISDM